jgi:hypothetical protein
MKRRHIAAASLTLLLTAAPAANAANGPDYLHTRLTSSGGFAEAGSSEPSTSLTEWAVMGLVAAGKRPGIWHTAGGVTPTAYLRSKAPNWDTAYEIERGILAVVALGGNPRSFAGLDLIGRLRNHVHSNGRIGDYLSSTYWGVIAFHAARLDHPRGALNYIVARQRPGGGYSWTASAVADSNDTAAAIMALRVGGLRCAHSGVSRAYRYLSSIQRPSRGYPLYPGYSADSQSTSWVIQARRKCALPNTGARSFLADRQLPSGAYNYQKGVTRTPAWVTAQVLPATNNRSYPIRP